MTVSTIRYPEPSRYPEQTGVPKHIQPFVSSGSIAGDTSLGYMAITWRFNFGSERKYQNWVVITEIAVRCTGGDPGDGGLFAIQAQWEDYPILRYPMAALVTQPVTLTNGVTEYWCREAPAVPWVLGRQELGTLATVETRFDNINGAQLECALKGYWADKAIIGSLEWTP